MKVKGIALFSGGLDSILAVKVIQEQGIEVQGVTFETPFFGARKAKEAARRIQLPLTVVDFTEDHLVMLKAPRYGYGKNMNPCIDCHTLMLKRAGRIMDQSGADFIMTGEVLGQRPMSQGKQSLHVVAKNAGYQEVIIRPLCARLLPETAPEREGKVDRQGLLDIQGRGRKRQIAMAEAYGIMTYETPAGGCLLTDPIFSRRLRELFDGQRDYQIRDIELLKYGRHFRLQGNVKVIVGRNRFDNEALENLSQDWGMRLHMADHPGPLTLLPHEASEDRLREAAALCALYSDAPKDRDVEVIVEADAGHRTLTVRAATKDFAAAAIL